MLWRRFTALCRERDETPDAVLRELVRLEVHRCERRKAKSAEGIDQRLLARLRLLVVEALVVSESRSQLQSTLQERGLRFIPAGGGLILVDLASGATLAKASQVGPPYLALARRFGPGFPGHPNAGLAARALVRVDRRGLTSRQARV